MRYFLATPFLFLAKVFAGITEFVSGHPCYVESIAESIDNGDVESFFIHADYIQDLEDALDDCDDPEEAMAIFEKYSKLSEALFEKESKDG